MPVYGGRGVVIKWALPVLFVDIYICRKDKKVNNSVLGVCCFHIQLSMGHFISNSI